MYVFIYSSEQVCFSMYVAVCVGGTRLGVMTSNFQKIGLGSKFKKCTAELFI